MSRESIDLLSFIAEDIDIKRREVRGPEVYPLQMAEPDANPYSVLRNTACQASVGLEWGLRFCISEELPVIADASGLKDTLGWQGSACSPSRVVLSFLQKQ